MKTQIGGKIVVEGPGKTQARSGLHRIIAQYWTHNPGREDRAEQPEQPQPKNLRLRANSRGLWASATTISYVQERVT
jgi:hypothetical protein